MQQLKQFVRFGIVGGLGFLVDAGVVQALVSLANANPYAGRLVSFLAAASFTWWLNRHFTFRTQHAPSHAEWVRYMLCMVVGGGINWLTYALVLERFPQTQIWPWIGVAAGSLTGMVANYLLAKKLVFERKPSDLA